MDRSIFNLTKYSIFHYLHCTDTQMNTHYSSALPPLPFSVIAGEETQLGQTGITMRFRRTDVLFHTHTCTHTLLLQSLGCSGGGGGEQMICRKPEVAYRTFFPPHARISQTASLKGSEVISQTLCPDWLAWVGIVCRGKNKKQKKQ